MQMKRFRLVLAVVATTIAISLTPLTAVAATTKIYHDSVGGVEVYATSTEGRFTGQASGKLPGVWYADVIHEALGSTASPKIRGGAFDLSTSLDNQPTLVTGQFTAGTVKQTGGFRDCTNQTYAVDGTLSNVGVYGRPDSGNGMFMATLTHYRVSIHGYCLIYAASIAGWVNLNF
jgi:hypothetical protein